LTVVAWFHAAAIAVALTFVAVLSRRAWRAARASLGENLPAQQNTGAERA
jgi:hypothetical protein